MLERFPANGLAWNQLAATYTRQGRWSEAEQALSTALKLEPIALEVWEMHANYYYTSGQYTACVSWAKRILTAYPAHPDRSDMEKFLELVP